MTYILFVIVVLVACIVIACIVSTKFFEEKIVDLSSDHLATSFIIVLALAILSPIIYEFKPLTRNTAQFRIVESDDGKYKKLIPNQTGFHPFFISNDYFLVCDKKETMVFDLEWLLKDQQVIWSFECQFNSNDPAKIYLLSDQYYRVSGDDGYSLNKDLIKKDIKTYLAIDIADPSLEEMNLKEIFNYINLKITEFNSDNPYGCIITLIGNTTIKFLVN